MKPKLILYLFIFFSIIAINGKAGTFIVTSNADSGPGTLREAITLANSNGTSVTDYIQFNIADVSEVGRTISLLTDLPKLTSKTVIDGSSQPGSPFGISDAKIILTTDIAGDNIAGLKILFCTEVEVYGLYLKDLHNADGWKTYGISLFNCEKIKIGKPGKGNYFSGNVESLNSLRNNETFYSGYSDSVSIQSNIFGLNSDGTDFLPGIYYSIRLYNAKNLILGGDNIDDGNFISGTLIQQVSFLSDSSIGKNSIVVKNNMFGISYSRDKALKFGGLHFQNLENTYTTNLTEITINNNSFENIANQFSNSLIPVISIISYDGYIDIKSNRINLLTADDSYFAGGSATTTCISLIDCKDGIIGGNSPSDTNYIIGGYTAGIALYNNEKITITKNSIYCNTKGISASSSKVQIPEVKIMSENGTNMVSGTATPNCKIEVFQTPFCEGCDNGRIYMGETNSDANGNWSFNGAYSSAVTANATNIEGITGEFSAPRFVQSNDYRNPFCGMTNGYIKGTQFISGTRYYWLVNNYSGTLDTVFNQLDLENIGPGIYDFVVEQTTYCKKSFRIVLSEYPIIVNDQFIQITHPACGQLNGKIQDIYSSGPYNKIFWLNENRDTISQTPNLSGVGEGSYKFIAINTIFGCADSTDWFALSNQSGPTLNINNNQITPALCGIANGSISGITASNVTGTPFIQWLDSLNNPVGSTLDLINIPDGKYKLKFKDQSSCDTIFTPFYTIQGLGKIGIDSSQMIVNGSNCNMPTGTITALTIEGATTYQWINSTGQTISNTLVPGNVYPGAYVLIATNSYGCENRTDTIRVPVNAAMTFNPPLQIQSNSGKCDQPDGYINILNFPNPQGYTFKWIDSLQPNITISTSLNLAGINSGTFILYAKNTIGCQQQALRYFLPYQKPPLMNTANSKITDEVCNNQSGSIQELNVVSGSGSPPFAYTWIDANNNIVSTQQNLSNVPAGNYTLIVKDNIGCSDTSIVLQIKNTIITLNNPKYDDQYTRINTNTTLSVLNPQPGTYLLFDNPNSTTPLEQNTQGTFTTSSLSASKTYYIQLVNGNCASSKVAVKIYVYDKTNIYVPSGFTPNNDSRNDVLKVNAYGIVSLEYFRIYNRYGQLVFSTKDISKGWDGTINGIPQATSVFVWMAKAKDVLTGELIEKKGTVLLIR